MALAAVAQECGFIKQLLLSVGIMLGKATKIFEDNTGCISLANNPMTTGKAKHIDVRYHFILDMVKSRAIRLLWCKSENKIRPIFRGFLEYVYNSLEWYIKY